MQVKREITLPGLRDVVWEALADPQRLGEWLGGTVDAELREGAEGTFWPADGDERALAVVEVVPGERLAFRWWGAREAETHVELRLEDVPGGTRLTVVESPVVLALLSGAPVLPAETQPAGPVALAA